MVGLFITLFLHQTTTIVNFYFSLKRCLSLYSYIKPQLQLSATARRGRCLSLYSYIKPQHVICQIGNIKVVYHSIPTSNHNSVPTGLLTLELFITLFLHQTTTLACDRSVRISLFITLFLHQTTTLRAAYKERFGLFITLFLHQTTTFIIFKVLFECCLSLYSYIKPQPQTAAFL